MKKMEAQELAQIRSKLIIEYINKILSSNEKVNASINLNAYKINGQKMCTADIYVPCKNFEKHLNLGITSDHISILHEQILNDLLSYLDDDYIGVTRFYSMRTNNLLFDGVSVTNTLGSSIKINMYGINRNISDEYNKKYDEYVRKLQSLDLKK